MKKRIWIPIVIIVLLAAFELNMERRFSLNSLEPTAASTEEILAEMPEIAISETDRALSAHVLSSAQVQDLLARAGNSRSSEIETLPAADTEALLQDWTTPECNSTELYVIPPHVYVTFYRNSPDSACTYTLFPNQESHIIKTIHVYEGTGKNRSCTAVYENQDGQLSKSVKKHLWFSWIEFYMEDRT